MSSSEECHHFRDGSRRNGDRTTVEALGDELKQPLFSGTNEEEDPRLRLPYQAFGQLAEGSRGPLLREPAGCGDEGHDTVLWCYPMPLEQIRRPRFVLRNVGERESDLGDRDPKRF